MLSMNTYTPPSDPLEYDFEDESLKILLDTPTMTIASIDSLSGKPLLLADIKHGDRLLRDVERFLYSFAEKNAIKSHTRSQAIRSGWLRLITTQKDDE